MSLRGRLGNFFKKSQVGTTWENDQEDGAASVVGGENAVDLPDWDILREEANGGNEQNISYDDLKKLVRFKGDTETNSGLEKEDVGGTDETGASVEVSPALQAFKNFFRTDMRVKREMIDLAPKSLDETDEEARVKYVDRAYKQFKGFRQDFLGIVEDFWPGDTVRQKTEDFFQRGENRFALSNYDSNVPRELYRSVFTDMRPEFVEMTKEIAGYYLLSKNILDVLSNATTINELLHGYHSCIMNDERVLQRVPAIAEKESADHDPIILRGDGSGLGRQAFDALTGELDVADTDIVSADDRFMMMVRSRGHALTISGEPDMDNPDKIWISYNVPKLCNEEMIKALPGLAGYSENGARGDFCVNREEFGEKLADFINRVPTDGDIPGVRRYAREDEKVINPFDS